MAAKKNRDRAIQSLLGEFDPYRILEIRHSKQIAAESLVWRGQLAVESEQWARIDDGCVGGVLQRSEELAKPSFAEKIR
jgi:hypothetical protein